MDRFHLASPEAVSDTQRRGIWTAPPSERGKGPFRVVSSAAVPLVGVLYLVLLFNAGGSRGEAALAAVGAAQFVCAVLLARAGRQRRGGLGRAWGFAALSAFASSSIFFITLGYDIRGIQPPLPSAIDAAFFLAVTAMLPSMLAFPRRTLRRSGRGRFVLDGVIVAASLMLIAWQLVIAATVRDAGSSLMETLLLASFPVADVVALSVGLSLATRIHPIHRRPLMLTVLGLFFLTLGDIAFGYLSLAGSWSGGHPVTITWVLGYCIIVLAANGAPSVADGEGGIKAQTRTNVAVLMIPVTAALLVTAVMKTTQGELIATVLLVMLVLVRQTLSLFSEQRLRAYLEGEVAERTEALRVQAFRDAVTGLPNRVHLRNHADELGRQVDETALLLLDLDGFKNINDTLGHAAGDELLVQVAARIQGAVRANHDTAARLGGDEFSVLLEQAGALDATRTAERIIECLRAPFVVSDTSVQLSGSVGIAVAGTDADLDVLLRNADLAMYEAKARGRDQAALFDPAMHQSAQARLTLDNEVRDAVRNKEFTVFYQPIVDTASGEVTSLEALVRWDHPRRGVVPPFEFLDAAERTGAIIELGLFVMRTACEQVARWRDDWPELSVAVNLSHRQLLAPNLVSDVADVLAETGLPATALHLEITETVLAAEAEIFDVVTSLVDVGVHFSIDDFGTGHSSLSRLRELPVERLKIDKSFIREISEGTAPLLSSIIALAHSLGRTVVAEGVETEEQLGFLLTNRCEEVQGYLMSRPVPPAHVVPLLFGRLLAPHGTHADAPIFAELIDRALNHDVRVSSVIERLLRELSEVSGLETTFLTTVDSGLAQQTTRYAYNTGSITVDAGLAVGWEDTLCTRMIDDGAVQCADVSQRYPDVAVARTLGIETYVSVPIRGSDGAVTGTLCGASRERRVLNKGHIELMELFAEVLAERLPELPCAHQRDRMVGNGPTSVAS